jgi:hypothetical protein
VGKVNGLVLLDGSWLLRTTYIHLLRKPFLAFLAIGNRSSSFGLTLCPIAEVSLLSWLDHAVVGDLVLDWL